MLLIAANKLIAILIPILTTVVITIILAIQHNQEKDREG